MRKNGKSKRMDLRQIRQSFKHRNSCPGCVGVAVRKQSRMKILKFFSRRMNINIFVKTRGRFIAICRVTEQVHIGAVLWEKAAQRKLEGFFGSDARRICGKGRSIMIFTTELGCGCCGCRRILGTGTSGCH